MTMWYLWLWPHCPRSNAALETAYEQMFANLSRAPKCRSARAANPAFTIQNVMRLPAPSRPLLSSARWHPWPGRRLFPPGSHIRGCHRRRWSFEGGRPLSLLRGCTLPSRISFVWPIFWWSTNVNLHQTKRHTRREAGAQSHGTHYELAGLPSLRSRSEGSLPSLVGS